MHTWSVNSNPSSVNLSQLLLFLSLLSLKKKKRQGENIENMLEIYFLKLIKITLTKYK